ncbi:hypothetical protein LCGC14_2529050 [marine sediment metagenome]|uniref:Uncharacterized protein n=1 Tax=marine sediment metagenome TaxID=412755 RepID=A0A0F9AUH6_9ZZZZ
MVNCLIKQTIASAFSKRKWPTKHKMFTIFDNWITELLEG